MKFLYRIRRRNTRLYWIPGHSGIEEHEKESEISEEGTIGNYIWISTWNTFANWQMLHGIQQTKLLCSVVESGEPGNSLRWARKRFTLGYCAMQNKYP